MANPAFKTPQASATRQAVRPSRAKAPADPVGRTGLGIWPDLRRADPWRVWRPTR